MSKINDEYNRLKYNSYGGNRIFYKWDNEAEAQETYDDRIFNCTLKGKTIQIRDSNELCASIKNKDRDDYDEVFKNAYIEEHKTKLIGNLIKNSFGDKVRQGSDGSFIINNTFMVDKNASAHVLKENSWEFLCIVVRKLGRRKIDLGELGTADLDPKLVEIMSKISFLIKPNTKDTVFMRQLPRYISNALLKEAGIR
tara:strand:+ start:88 stop:678 length:591 start_codon:yes stop_codon:yes gene_type:complete